MIQRIPRGKDEKLDQYEENALIATLEKYDFMAQQGEDARQNRDRKGTKLYNSMMWDTRVTSGKQVINSASATALFERVCAMITKYRPVPHVEAIGDADADGAAMLAGGILTNWDTYALQELVKQTYRLVGFTRPAYWYVSWDADARGGIGDYVTRLIPGYRCIVDDRHRRVKDMEFPGVREQTTRAKLMKLFPDKAEEIENATAPTTVYNRPNNRQDNPLRLSSSDGASGSDVRISLDGGTSFKGVTGVSTGRDKNADPLAAQVTVEYLWIDDLTPQKDKKPKTDRFGRVLYEPDRSKAGEILFDINGYETVETPFGPLLQPNLSMKRKPILETAITRKYPHRRYVAWIPQDKIILLDARWDGPIPLVAFRESYCLDGFWSEGTGLRLTTLAVARNILFTIIQERLKLSLGGSWLATPSSGLKKNKLIPESGTVFYANRIDAESIKQFPVDPLDAAYFQLLGILDAEMQKLLGMSGPMQGEAAGRADSPATYDKLIEAGGVTIVDRAQVLEQSIQEWCEIALWFMQHFYTHEHVVELELEDGASKWAQAHALLMQGDMRVRIEPTSMIAWSESALWERAKEYYSMGLYAKPMLGKMGHVPKYREALEQIGRLLGQPGKQYLIGNAAGGGMPPPRGGRMPGGSPQRSHHGPPRQ